MTRRRRQIALIVTGSATIAVVVGLALFQPWKLWVDDEVDQAVPAGAVVVAAPPETTSPPPASAPADAVAPPPTVEPVAPPTVAVPPPTTTPPTTPPTTPTTTPPTSPPPPVPAGGEFAGIDHGTTGRLVLLQDAAGTQYVRLEELDTSNGPDLFVYLSTNAPDGPEEQFDDDVVNLGRLQGNVGSSNYVVPAGTDLSRYASVVIWCDRFNSAFGAAPLV